MEPDLGDIQSQLFKIEQKLDRLKGEIFGLGLGLAAVVVILLLK